MSEESRKNDTIMFSCEKELKEQYYEICRQNGVNPHSLLRGFMRRAVKDWKDKKLSSEEGSNESGNDRADGN